MAFALFGFSKIKFTVCSPPKNTKNLTNTLAVQIIHNWRKESKNVQETEIKQALFENRTRQAVLFIGQFKPKAECARPSHHRFSQTNKLRLTYVRNYSSRQKRESRPFVF